ncbi:MAG: sugar ABC transporter permease, partial [Clostridiales bacterium]|nr:sugar ABC transporter permease [Clostridiales bacterium]
YRFNLGILGSKWVGFDNFIELFSVNSFKEVFTNTIVISFYKLVLGFPAPIIFAILLNEMRNQKYKRIAQTISYLPHFLSWVILGGIFMQFLSPSDGPINIILKHFGYKPIYFIADVKWFRTVLVTTSIWKDFGWSSIVFLAALTGINPEIYEAAEIDGANRIQRIIHVTIPGLTPVITIMFIFAVGKLITDDFDQIFNLYNPAVYKVGDVLSTYTYRVGLVQMRYSYATAVGMFKNIISFALVLTANTITKRINEYGLW